MKSNQVYLTVNSISKTYSRTKKHVLEDISFNVGKGQLATIFGPNGCGKTTLMSIIAGTRKPNSGSVSINKKSTSDSEVSFLFQNYADSLFPWKTCLDNITFPLELRGVEKVEREKRAKKLVKELEIKVPLNQYPYQCSGGQKQLTAIARSLIIEPDLFLLDEPFSALDYDMKTLMENRFLDIWSKTKVTTLLISHDLDECVRLSDKILIMKRLPSKIIDEIHVDLPRPRDSKIIETDRFNEIKNSVYRKFIEGKQGGA